VRRDILIQSNGHTVPVRYAVMARAGYFPRSVLLSLRKFDSILQGHPERMRIPALETTSGPLGSGLSQACGMALSLMMERNITRRIYCTMGDGELNEGNIWEAAMLASKYRLGNIIGIVDRNNIQIDGMAEDVMPMENLREKWEAFGWYVQEVDGNNIESVCSALNLAKSQTAKPNLIIAHTIPGKGVDFMEYDYHWHGKAPDKQQEQDAMKKLRTLDGKIEGGNL
jgi:transketolase